MAEKKITPKQMAGSAAKGGSKSASTARKNKRVMSAKVKSARSKRWN